MKNNLDVQDMDFNKSTKKHICARNGTYKVKQNKYVRDTTKCKEMNMYMTWPLKVKQKQILAGHGPRQIKQQRSCTRNEHWKLKKNEYVQDMDLKQSNTKNE